MFNYLAPLIFPLLGERNSKLEIGIPLRKILLSRSISSIDAKVIVETKMVLCGRAKLIDKKEFSLKKALSSDKITYISQSANKIGYLEISIISDKPIFNKLDFSPGYSIYSRQNSDPITVIPDTKFARPILIDQFRDTGKFSLVHSASYHSNKKNCGNSIFFVNPYENTILIRIRSSSGNSKSLKLNSMFAMLIHLDDISENENINCTQITANNRLPAWDIKHSLSNEKFINNVDHLDVFRGTKTLQETSTLQNLKDFVREKIHDLY